MAGKEIELVVRLSWGTHDSSHYGLILCTPTSRRIQGGNYQLSGFRKQIVGSTMLTDKTGPEGVHI